jgi:hypothetical protein
VVTRGVSYPRARDAVRTALAGDWTDGTFWLDDRLIVEDREFYYFRVGAREWLIDGDHGRARYGGAVPAVAKVTGRLLWMPEVRVALRHKGLRYRPNPEPTDP